MIPALEQWQMFAVKRADEGDGLILASCPVCGAALVNHDSMGMARHALWHHERGEWPWREM